MATLLRSTSGTPDSPPNMCRALPIWLNSWSAATHMKSAYMNSTTGRNRPSSAMPPARPANPFSLIGVPRIRSGNRLARPRVAPLVPPFSRCTSSPSTTMPGSVSIRRPMTAATASMNLVSWTGTACPSALTSRTPSNSLRSPRIPASTQPGSGHSDGLICRWPGLPPGTGSSRTWPISASTAWARVSAPAVSSAVMMPRRCRCAAVCWSGSRSRQARSSALSR